MKVRILKDVIWTEDSSGYYALINQLNESILSEKMKVFIQKAGSATWTEVPIIPNVSTEGYAYSGSNVLRIFYLGNEAPDKLLIKIDY